jgi:hypothetical protein
MRDHTRSRHSARAVTTPGLPAEAVTLSAPMQVRRNANRDYPHSRNGHANRHGAVTSARPVTGPPGRRVAAQSRDALRSSASLAAGSCGSDRSRVFLAPDRRRRGAARPFLTTDTDRGERVRTIPAATHASRTFSAPGDKAAPRHPQCGAGPIPRAEFPARPLSPSARSR